MLYSKSNELFQLLSRRNFTLASAESCTGGLIGSTMTDIVGSSKVYLGGIIAYNDSIKINILGVKKEIIDKFSAISKETAISMAENIKCKYSADIGISVTGNAGPYNLDDKEVGEIYIAVSFGKENRICSICEKLATENIICRKNLKELAALNSIQLVINILKGDI